MQVFGGFGVSVDNGNPVFELGFAEGIVSVNKEFYDGLERLKAAAKATAATAQNRDKGTQVGIDAFDVVRVTLVVNIPHVFAGKHYVEVAVIAVRGIFLSPRRTVYDVLNVHRALVHCHFKANNHAGFRVYHRHQVDVFSRFGFRLFLNEPIQLVKLVSRPRFPLFNSSSAVFFNPVVHRALPDAHQFPHAPSAYARVISFHRLLLGFLRLFPRLAVQRVFVVAEFAYTSLRARPVVPSVDLIFCPPTFRTPPVLIYRLFSHAPILPRFSCFV